MASTTVSVRGDRRLAKQLAALRVQATEIAADTLKAWGKDVRDEARRRVPVLTGELRKGITIRVQRKAMTATVGTHTGPYYGVFVENGTSRQAAQPFLHPAAAAHSNIRPYVRTALDARLP
ncbi:phage protein, HK97 gp10 family [Saccharopolyspora kobensis]|uniref:Phage protein, HK97 gp10 family n=1 Tax=Saccharopolyspora kobensis TaxID=146035 RepID=A0A1H6E1F1_9PSEU|nr:HK97-gp10 family putative phage morphogenesis protein [Saccharopolyspora kobensis]SEG90755.1 phage protein, HK97 gp10 family [Saccharopolyspora kobensis]SFD93639.1 phage protein, HK97 gp10 family [Saccharopolyspora kobensis]